MSIGVTEFLIALSSNEAREVFRDKVEQLLARAKHELEKDCNFFVFLFDYSAFQSVKLHTEHTEVGATRVHCIINTSLIPQVVGGPQM